MFKNNELLTVPIEEKLELLYFNNFFTKNKKYIDSLLKSNKKMESLNNIIPKFKDDNINFDLDDEYCLQLFNKYFTVVNNEIELREIREIYKHTYILKLKYFDYLKITMDYLISIYREAEKNLSEYFEKMDFKQTGYISFNKLEELLVNILAIKNDNWKVVEAIK